MTLGARLSTALRVSTGCTLVFGVAFASPLRAQSESGGKLPVEFLQGFVASDGAPVRPYLASAAIVPGYSFEAIRLGVKVSLDYENPGWTARFGPRVSRRVGHVFRNDIGFILGAEATTNVDWEKRVGAGLTFDVDGLIRVGVWSGWDERRDGGWFGVIFGADPTSWFTCVPDDIDPSQCYGAEQ